jgi:outer membrane receptor protein involved in Fe transport
LYLQDRVEFQDFILNLGLRWDYFHPDYRRFKNPLNPLSFGDPTTGDHKRVSKEDFEEMPNESYLSPRIGFAFPVTVNTVLHAQYGIFRQSPRLLDLYYSWINLEDIETISGQGQRNGHLKSEETTQYEFGLKQQFGNSASLDVTAYYKNTKGLTNLVTIFTEAGNNYITWTNTDFGTIKGLAFSFNLRRLGPVSAKVDYTLSLSEGTGSSQSSAFTATFRNPGNVTPTAIAPLDFDQRHTLTASVDVRAGENEGPAIFGAKLLANSGANFLITYNSGRPYTPVASWNLLTDVTQQGNLTQYVNSAYSPGVFRIDLKADRTFDFGRFSLVPYVWIQNLLNRENFVNVWRSTGEPDNTAYLETAEGQDQREREQAVRGNDDWARDYMALERDPTNYGIPRLVRFGLKMKF